MATLQHALLLNNEGHRRHVAGDLTGAMHVYQMGYFTTQELLRPITQLQNISTVLPTATEAIRAAMVDSTVRIQRRAAAKLETVQPHLCFVTYRPLVLQPQENDSVAILCFLRYNIALVYHELGIRSGCDSLLRSATDSYDWTLLMLCNYTISHDKHGVLMRLSLNNLAHLHYDRCDFRSSQSCLECMNYLITGMRCLEDQTVALFLSKRECDQIKLNVVHLKPPVAAGAA